MPSSHPKIPGTEAPKSRFDEAFEVYKDLIRDPAFARIKAGGVLPRKTKWLLCPEIIDLDDGFAFLSVYYTDKNGKRVAKNANCWKMGNVRYKKWTRSRSIRRDQSKNKSKWHVPKLVYIQGRMARERPDPRNSRPRYYTYDEDGELVWHDRCKCGGSLEYDNNMNLYCTAPGCGLIWSDGTRTGVFNQKGDVKK